MSSVDDTDEIRSFRHRVGIGHAVSDRVRQWLGQRLLRRSLPLFVRGGDWISLKPLVNGSWDPTLQALFTHAARRGYQDFFIDIGANIGLTSCQCGDFFREVLMFEPNSEIFPILELNARLALRTCRVRAFNFGLGPTASSATLNVPFDNFGGAFIHDEHNAYTDDLFAARHSNSSFDLGSYRQVPIRIEATSAVLPPLFDELRARGLTKGVIKIDAEGYEKAILKSMAPLVPGDVRLMIVFENWDDSFDIDSVLASFSRPVQAFRVSRRPTSRGALWRDLPSMLLSGGAQFGLEPLRKGRCEGEIVLLTP
jgi:FkbM family methyltransferase